MMLPLITYLSLVFAFTFYAYFSRVKNGCLQDYFIGNRSMGGFLLAMTITTTYISASSFIGGPGAAYKYGLGWVLLSLLQLPAIWLSLGVIGKKVAILARRYHAITLNDILLARFESPLLVWLASISLLIAFIGAMTVQFVGGARLLETVSGISYDINLLIFGISIVLYTTFGGFRGSVLNDAFQGIVMLLGTGILLIAVIYASGGISAAVTTLHNIDPALVSPTGADNVLSPKFVTSFWILVCFGVIGLPHTAIRCISCRDSKSIHVGTILGTILIGVLMLGMHLAGALGRAILPGLTVPDLVVPTLMVKLLPPFVAGIFLAAPLAAIMSTINAQLLQSSATIMKDLYLSLHPQQTNNECRLRYLSSLVTFALGLLLLLTSWHPPEMIIWLNLLAFGGMESVFMWPLVFGLYWKRANSTGAWSSMVVGGTSYTLMVGMDLQPGGFHPVVLALTISLLAFLIANPFGRIAVSNRITNKF